MNTRVRPAMTLGECVICHAQVMTTDEPAEMYDPAMFDPDFTEEERMVAAERSGLVHAQCGITAGWEVS